MFTCIENYETLFVPDLSLYHLQNFRRNSNVKLFSSLFSSLTYDSEISKCEIKNLSRDGDYDVIISSIAWSNKCINNTGR